LTKSTKDCTEKNGVGYSEKRRGPKRPSATRNEFWQERMFRGGPAGQTHPKGQKE